MKAEDEIKKLFDAAGVDWQRWSLAIDGTVKRITDELDELRAERPVLLGALSTLVGAANAVYIEDDVFTEWKEGDGKRERDDALGDAIHVAVQALALSDRKAE